LKPRDGASDSIVAASGVPETPLPEGGAVTLFPTGVGTLVGSAGGVFVPALITLCCAPKVVETTGHPFPGPFRFCNVIAAAFSRAD
jgi:hypothetical protein